MYGWLCMWLLLHCTACALQNSASVVGKSTVLASERVVGVPSEGTSVVAVGFASLMCACCNNCCCAMVCAALEQVIASIPTTLLLDAATANASSDSWKDLASGNDGARV